MKSAKGTSPTGSGRRLLRVVAATASLALLLAACGGGDAPEAAPAGDGPTETDGDTDGASTDDPGTIDEPLDDDRGSAADVYDEFNAMTGQERHDLLVERAQEEGSVVFYTAGSGWDPVIAEFEDRYDIDVDVYRGNADTVLQRIFQEYQAGFHGVDVYDDSEAFQVAQAGMTYEYVNDELTADLPGFDSATHVAPTRLSVYVQGWNPTLVDESELPDTLDGFTDPKWEGRLGLDPRDWVWYIGLMEYYTAEGWTEDEVDEMISTLASYSAHHPGHTTQAQLLMAGEFDASLTIYTQSADRELVRDENAPIAWRKSDGSYIKPLIYQAQGSALMKNAPHPHAALLFKDFLISDGAQMLAEVDRTPSGINFAGGPLDGVPNEDLHEVDNDKYLNERDIWTTRWDELLRR